MTKTELKKTITNLNKLLRAGEYSTALELAVSLDEPAVMESVSESIFAAFKKILKKRDYAVADQLIDGIYMLGAPSVFEKLLNGCAIDAEGKLVRNALFSGSAPQLAFNDYVLLNLIGHAPENCIIGNSIKRKNIIELKRYGGDYRSSSGSESKMACFPIGICKCNNLKKLDFSWNDISELPPEIGELNNLESLDVGYNGSWSKGLIIPKEIGNLKKLKSLDLHSCDIDALPVEVCKLPKLETLDVSGNKLNSFSTELWNHPLIFKQGSLDFDDNPVWKSIDSIDLCLNDVENLNNTHVITMLYNADYGYSSDRQTAYIKHRLRPLMSRKETQEVTSINLAGYSSYSGSLILKVIPQFLQAYNNLLTLELRHNEITVLSPELGKLNKLEELDLRNNKLSELSSLIGKLKNLTTLQLDGNNLSALPAELGQLTKLTALGITGNDIQSLPAEMRNLSGMQNLIWESTTDSTKDISASFEVLSQISGLETLHLILSKAVHLPPEIGTLQNINELVLECSSLQSLPDEFGNIANLEKLELRSCNNLTDVNALTQLSKLSMLQMETSKKVKPYPRPMNMETRGEVDDYFRRLLKASGKELPDILKKKESGGDRATAAKLKKFLKQRDYDAIDQGIELARSLSDPLVYESLLEGCKIDDEGYLIRNKAFSGSGPAQPYLDYALWNLIGHAPEKTQMDNSLKRTNITVLQLSNDVTNGGNIPDWVYECSNLEVLNWKWTLNGISSDLSQLTKLKELRIVNAGLTSLFDFPKLCSLSLLDLSFNNLTGIPNIIYNLEGLTTLNLESNPITEISPNIKNLINLQYLNIKGEIKEFPDELFKLKKLNSLPLECPLFYSTSYNYSTQSWTLDLSDPKVINDIYTKIENFIDRLILSKNNDLMVSLLNSAFCLNYNSANKITLDSSLKETDTIDPCSIFQNTKFYQVFSLQLLAKLPDEVVQKTIISCDKIQKIYLPKGFDVFPEWISKFKNATEIDISDTNINSFPKYFVNFKNLSKLKFRITDYESADRWIKEIKSIGNKKIFESMLHGIEIDPGEFDEINDLKKSGYLSKGEGLLLDRVKDINYPYDIYFFWNLIGVIPEKIEVHSSLLAKNITKINLSYVLGHEDDGKPISKFPENIYNFSNLDELIVNRTNIELLPDGISSLEKLKKLEIQENSLKNFPTEISNIQALEVLNISFSYNLEQTPIFNVIKSLKFLGTLKNTGNKIDSLNKSFSSLKSLKRLDLSCNDFREIPQQLYSMKNLEIINFSNNNIKRVSNDLLSLKKLKSLNLTFNKKNINVPDELLKAEGMDFNFSASIEKPQGKKKLDPKALRTVLKDIKDLIKSRSYHSIDEGIALARSYDSPILYEKILNGCSHDSSSYDAWVRNSLFTGSNPAQPYLDYALYNFFGYAPDNATIDSSLKRKNITSLAISSWNRWCGKGKDSSIELSRFPKGICQLTNLKNLTVSGDLGGYHSDYEPLPIEIANLKKLEYLKLKGNNYSNLPPEIGLLPKLKHLDVSGNANLIIPDTIKQLTSLKILMYSGPDTVKKKIQYLLPGVKINPDN
ncbi:MAG: hypothetical protein HOM19_02235 [Candidatus Marinimicrobia bacterium]|jgi:Leucine-rich repeat (LRR) protein|nr:hypothetical protein [Candidatus Neomarinimicrobiota bacterium]